ncbi:unnamed protein product [Prorocentrum cordatum]|uniref:Uncharacterized protein n=1 Tax=Prorocentrum cordatum TaxID=2364126 RepID=A0ABN9QTB1_9DINO|nr:unnamed protein product [Polarella glacialis]
MGASLGAGCFSPNSGESKANGANGAGRNSITCVPFATTGSTRVVDMRCARSVWGSPIWTEAPMSMVYVELLQPLRQSRVLARMTSSCAPPLPPCWRLGLSYVIRWAIWRRSLRPWSCSPQPSSTRRRLAKVVEDSARQVRLACQGAEQKRTKSQNIREQLDDACGVLLEAGEAQTIAQQVQRDADQAMQAFSPEVWKVAKAAEAREAEAERQREQRAAPPAAAPAGARAMAQPAARAPGGGGVAGGGAAAMAVDMPDFGAMSAEELAAWAREHSMPAALWEAFVAMRATL